MTNPPLNQEQETTPGAPLVSVVIPAYQVTEYIGAALDSVFAQTFGNFEVIVVNDGSPDTPELERTLEPYRDRLVYIRQENRGVSGARNTGIKVARGEFYAQLDPDDLWETDYLDRQLQILRETGADLVFPNARVFGDGPEAGRLFLDLMPFEGPVTAEKLLRLECTVVTSVTARRDVLLRAGMYDESIRTSEDFDLWLRVALQGSRIVVNPEPVLRYRQRAESLSSDPRRMLRSALAVLEKTELAETLSAAERAALFDGKRLLAARIRLCEGKEAFAAGDVPGAISGLSDANVVLCDRRMAWQLRLLRWCPGLLMRAYQVRQRYGSRPAARY